MADVEFSDQICHMQSDGSNLNVKNSITKLGREVDIKLMLEEESFKLCVGLLISVNQNWM